MVPIPLLMVISFILITLITSLRYIKKPSSFREYAVGDKSFSTATLVATSLATAIGGFSIMGNIVDIHSLGIYAIVASIGICLSCWVVSWLALRMQPFMHNLSMVDTIGRVYGKYPRMITSLAAIGYSIFIVSMQINAMGQAIHVCTNSLHPRAVTLFSAFILMFYTTTGGIRLVTFTDIMQAVTLFVILPILSYCVFTKSGKTMIEAIGFLHMQEKFQLSRLLSSSTDLKNLAIILLCFMTSWIDVPVIQRIYMSSNSFQASRVFFYTGVLMAFAIFFVIQLGVCTFLSEPDIMTTEILYFITKNTSPTFNGLFSVGLLAAAMSTADSHLNSCSVVFSHDLIQGILYPNNSCIFQLKVARIASVLVCLFSIILGFYFQGLFTFFRFAVYCRVPIAVAPFILAVLGFRLTSHAALAGMASGLLTAYSCHQCIYFTGSLTPPLVGMLANGLTMFILHYLFSYLKRLYLLF